MARRTENVGTDAFDAAIAVTSMAIGADDATGNTPGAEKTVPSSVAASELVLRSVQDASPSWP